MYHLPGIRRQARIVAKDCFPPSRLRTSAAFVLVFVTSLCGGGRAAAASDAGLLVLQGIGAEGKPAYRSGGKVRFLDVRLPYSLIHFADTERVPLPIEISYEVLQPAPVVLTSRLGTEYWRIVHCPTKAVLCVYTDERIDLSRPGTRTARATRARAAKGRGPEFAKGLCIVCGRSYFLIDPPKGDQWLDVTRPPPFFDLPRVTRRLVFTLADLTRYSLAVDRVQSTWRPGGPIRVRLVVRDAGGDVFPVVNVPAELRSADGGKTALTTQFDALDLPTGWLYGRLPAGSLPDRFTFEATVAVLGPDGKSEKKRVVREIRKGEGTASAEDITVEMGAVRLPRTPDGRVRETRALWVAPSDIKTREDIRTLVERAVRARINVLIPDVFVRSQFLARSPLFPMQSRGIEEALDPLDYLIHTAHAHGIEVHPWFCVTYRDAAFRKTMPGVDIIDRNGKVVPLGADVHRPEYRKFIVDLMTGVARDYPVDGIHLDYIRVMHDCWCPKCRAEFQEKFGKSLEKADEADWIAWHRAAVGAIVRATAEGVRKARPKAVLSAAVFANMKGGARQGQDPAGWVRNGRLDVVMPMDYAMQTLVVHQHESEFLEALDDDGALVTGLSLYQRVGGRATPRPPALVKTQILLVRRMGIHGYCLFASPYLDDAIIRMLRTEVNLESAVPYFRQPDGSVRRPRRSSGRQTGR